MADKDRQPINRRIGFGFPNQTVREMMPGESWSPNRSAAEKADANVDIKPISVEEHARGGMVKHGSPTRVTCKTKG